MPRFIIHTRLSRSQLAARLMDLPRMLSGRGPDRLGIRRGFRLRLAVAWLEKIKLAFITKSRGGTDDAGISWPPLSKKYLAYQRGPKSTRTAGGLSPGGKDGFMNASQLKVWRRIYARNLARLAATTPIAEAKAIAASIAWSVWKREGGLTKLEVFGNRQVEILRDRGILFNSLSPGVLSEHGPAAEYSPPAGQLIEDRGEEFAVGTHVDYAKYHQGDDEKPGKRRLWPRADEIPGHWKRDLAEIAASGLPIAIQMIAREAA